MNAERLLALYDRVADAPDAIARLRRFVLALAVRGKLVAQDAGDEPASELLKRIAAEKARLVKAGMITKPKSSAPIEPDELPVEVPSQWSWVRLQEIGVLSGGMTPSKNRPDYWDGDVVWLSPKDIKADELTDSELKITAKGLSETRLEQFPAGSLFIVARSGILKRTFPVAINRVSAASNQDLKVLVPYLKGGERYLQIMFRGLTDFLLTELVKTGTTVQSLKYAQFEVQPFPLPPLAEQRRIVAKVDELMVLCDRLEAARTARKATRDRLTAASLARLNAPETDAAALRNHTRFALDTLPALTTRPDQIKQLRQTILNLAVRGALATNAADDESVQLPGANKKVRRGVPDDVPIPEMVREWSLPPNWRTVSVATMLRSGLLADLKDGNHGANHPKKADYSDEGLPFIAAAHVRDHQIDCDGAPKISGPALAKIRIGHAHAGDVILTHKATIGRVAIANRDGTVRETRLVAPGGSL